MENKKILFKKKRSSYSFDLPWEEETLGRLWNHLMILSLGQEVIKCPKAQNAWLFP